MVAVTNPMEPRTVLANRELPEARIKGDDGRCLGIDREIRTRARLPRRGVASDNISCYDESASAALKRPDAQTPEASRFAVKPLRAVAGAKGRCSCM